MYASLAETDGVCQRGDDNDTKQLSYVQLKLPGSTLIPWRNQMAPITISKPPTMFRVTLILKLRSLLEG